MNEAHRLFKISTLNAAQSGMTSNKLETPVELIPLITKIEETIKRRVAIGVKIGYDKLKQELMQRFENSRAIDFVSLIFYIVCRLSSAWSEEMSWCIKKLGRSSPERNDLC